MTIGECIKVARTNANMTQMELAEASGIPYQTIGHWERDTSSPKYSSLEQIARALNISMETLISGKNTEAEVELKTANILSVIYEKIDEELRSTEATDISMYHAWMQVAPEVRRIIVDEAKEMINTVEENPAQCTRKTMDSATTRMLNRMNTYVESANEMLDSDDGEDPDPNTVKVVAAALTAVLQNLKQIMAEYETYNDN